MDGLCDRCRDLDILSILRYRRVHDWQGERIAGLGNTTQWATSTCALCKLFLDLREPSVQSAPNPEQRRLDNLELRAFSTKRLKESECDSIDMSKLTDTTVLGITYDVGEFGGSAFERQEIGCIHMAAIGRKPLIDRIQARLLDQHAVQYDTILEWLQKCNLQHGEECGSVTYEHIDNFWLIDCESQKVVPAGHGYRYAALSYVWGKHDVQQSSTGQYDFTHAAKTIRDAIDVTLALDLRYLWVDKYCIKSNNAEHMMQQVRQMHKIYAQAYVAIIAAGGQDASSGLPGVNGNPRARQPQACIGSSVLVSSLPWISFDLQYTVWASRAWTFQEGALSHRRLIFTDKQVYFECLKAHASECISDPTTFAPDANTATARTLRHKSYNQLYNRHFGLGTIGFSQSGRGVEHDVERHINTYTRRALSYQSDVLNAIMGVITVLEEHTPMKFLWGMPYTTVPSDPTKTFEEAMMRRISRINFNVFWSGKQRRAGFPSWSWTGWLGGTVSLERIATEPTSYDCHVQVELSSGVLISLEELQMSQIPPSPYLHIEGRAVPIYLKDWTPPTSENGKYQIMSCHLYARTRVDDERYRISIEPHGVWSVQEYHDRSAKQFYALVVEAGMYEDTHLRVIVLESFGDHYEVFGNGYYSVEKPDSEYGVVEGGLSAAAVQSLPRRSFRVG